MTTQKIASFFSNCFPFGSAETSSAQSLQIEPSIPFANESRSMQILHSLKEKIIHVAQFIFKATVTAFLYWTNPSLFAFGFIAGIIFEDHVSLAIDKIKNVWNSQPWSLTLIGGFACALSMPVTLAAGSILWAAHLGAMMSSKAQLVVRQGPSLGDTPEMPLLVVRN